MFELECISRRDREWLDFMTPGLADSLVGKCVAVVRDMQYEVREGGEAGEVVVIPKAFIAKRNQSFILLVQEKEDETCH